MRRRVGHLGHQVQVLRRPHLRQIQTHMHKNLFGGNVKYGRIICKLIITYVILSLVLIKRKICTH